jgi:hypothetical protein
VFFIFQMVTYFFFSCVSVGNLAALLPNATTLESRFFGEM